MCQSFFPSCLNFEWNYVLSPNSQCFPFPQKNLRDIVIHSDNFLYLWVAMILKLCRIVLSAVLSLFYAGGNVCLVKEIVLFNRYFVATEIRVSVLLWDHFAYYTKTILYPYLYYYITIILYIYPIKCQGVQWIMFLHK